MSLLLGLSNQQCSGDTYTDKTVCHLQLWLLLTGRHLGHVLLWVNSIMHDESLVHVAVATLKPPIMEAMTPRRSMLAAC